jgi:hypothetical protein
MAFTELLALLDRYPHRVEVKGGSRQFNSPNIIITSIMSPEKTYSFLDKEEPLGQLMRRIDHIVHKTNEKTDTEVTQTDTNEKTETNEESDHKVVSDTDTEVGGNTRTPSILQRMVELFLQRNFWSKLSFLEPEIYPLDFY